MQLSDKLYFCSTLTINNVIQELWQMEASIFVDTLLIFTSAFAVVFVLKTNFGITFMFVKYSASKAFMMKNITSCCT